MNKWIAFFLTVCIFCFTESQACTTFFLQKNGQMAFGKNYDWTTGVGSVNINLRGLAKTSLRLDDGNQVKWVSKYGSTTFNQYGKEFPNGGMNEKGLVVELMWLSESEFPKKDNRPGLSVLQWIQYQLDNCASVDEVVATDKLVRIISTGAPQHFLVADHKGNVATIELLNGKINIHRGSELPVPVLTNSTYDESLRALKNNRIGDNSLSRFSNACKMVQQYEKVTVQKPLIDYSFEILNNVAQSGFTKWSIVYDITNQRIYFKTSDHPQQKMVALADFNYNCSSPMIWYNLAHDDKGDVSKKFVAFNGQDNKKLLKEAFKESSGLNISDALQNQVARFAEEVKCK